jgi:hypothetical protein
VPRSGSVARLWRQRHAVGGQVQVRPVTRAGALRHTVVSRPSHICILRKPGGRRESVNAGLSPCVLEIPARPGCRRQGRRPAAPSTRKPRLEDVQKVLTSMRSARANGLYRRLTYAGAYQTAGAGGRGNGGCNDGEG